MMIIIQNTMALVSVVAVTEEAATCTSTAVLSKRMADVTMPVSAVVAAAGAASAKSLVAL